MNVLPGVRTGLIATLLHVAPAQGQAGELRGLYASYSSGPKTGYNAHVGSFDVRYEAEATYLYFLPGGQVFEGIPQTGYDALDCARTPVKGCQPYKVQGGRIQIGAAGAQPVKIAGQTLTIGERQYTFLPPQRDLRLNGQYQNLNAASSAGGAESGTFASASSAYTFSQDGRFELRRGGGSNSNAGGGAVTTFRRDQSSGRYRIDGYTLLLRFENGQQQRVTFFPGSEPKYIYLNGQQYRR